MLSIASYGITERRLAQVGTMSEYSNVYIELAARFTEPPELTLPPQRHEAQIAATGRGIGGDDADASN